MTGARLVVWDDEACWQVHEATLALLEETGVEVGDEAALRVFAEAGARVDGRRVRIGADLVEGALAGAPRRFPLKARPGGARDGSDGPDAVLTAALDLEIADGRSYFGTGPDCRYVRDPETGERRRATLADVEGMASLCEKLPGIDFVMSMGLPADVPEAVDDLAPFAAMLSGTRKPLLATVRDARSLAHMREMAAACGEPASFACYALSSPPLRHADGAAAQILACAQLEIPLVYAPAPVAGETAPASIAATVLVGNAEVLSALVLHQLVRAGAPFVLGVGCGTMDMRSTVEVFGAPELYLGNAAACDLCHFYGLPSFAYAAVSDAKVLDEQWAAEAGISAVLGALSRATLLHDVGYLEAGRQSSFETIVLGHELVCYARALMHEVGVDPDSLALGEIAAVGPGGSFAGRDHTREHEREFWSPALFERGVFDLWQAEGATTLRERVTARAEALRTASRTFELDDEARAALDAALTARREA
jgi:trimethylamine---corrinoid protein Co-methyltransferase